MKQVQKPFPIVGKNQLNLQAFDFLISCPEVAEIAQAGQFVNIRCGEKMLRRPISICETDAQAGTLRLVFEIRGEGTQWLAERRVGETLDLLAPLGNGFSIPSSVRHPVVIGGGIGVPPLLQAAKECAGKADAILGFRSRENTLLTEEFKQVCNHTFIATEDGSLGRQGFVTQVLEQELVQQNYDLILACGPMPMLKAVAEMAHRQEIACQVSLEERMGCGVGACLVCTCRTKKRGGGICHSRVCKEGPVFSAEEVLFG